MSKEHVLTGLEPDNLLAFMALLGFHRALDHAKPAWNSRTYWGGIPLRPRFVLHEDVDRDDLLRAAATGCAALAEVHSFDRRENVDYSKKDARALLEEACGLRDNRMRIDLLSSLMSDVAVRDDDKVRPTPFCALFGQGHQHFLERLEAVPKGIPPKELQKEVTTDDLNSPTKLEEALFDAWNRKDRTQSFRWDPLEDRRYALRFEDPSSEKGLTVHGANRLASLALALLPSVPKRERGEVRLYGLMTSWEAGSLQVRWPIWARPASLPSVRMMLAGCGSPDRTPGLGISDFYRSERITVGKFFNFTRASSDRRY